jgi:hypothetical protein
MNEDEGGIELTDAVLRLKRAFEDKSIDAMRALFTGNPHINVDGRFHTLPQFLESMQALFEAVDQTYLDVVGTRRVESDEDRMFAVFDLDVAWIDKKDWMERTQKVVLSLETVRDPKTRQLAVAGMSATTLHDHGGEHPKEPPPNPPPGDGGGGGDRDGEDEGIWY